jgi:hypothetical protein
MISCKACLLCDILQWAATTSESYHCQRIENSSDHLEDIQWETRLASLDDSEENSSQMSSLSSSTSSLSLSDPSSPSATDSDSDDTNAAPDVDSQIWHTLLELDFTFNNGSDSKDV